MSAWQTDGDEISGRVIAVGAVIAVLALVIGLALGMYLGRSSAPGLGTLAGQARQNAAALEAQLAPAAGAYDAAVPAGTITDPTGYAKAQERITRVRAQLAAQHATFEALAPGDYRRATAAVAALATAASTPVPPAAFDKAFAAATAALGVLAGR
ncbi:MAG: hypothetical protein ACR2JV_08325 [Gaiellales bacterium]